MSKKKGVDMPRITSGMNKLPPKDLSPAKDDERGDLLGKDDKNLAKDADLIDAAKKRFKAALTVESKNRTDAVEDLKFVNGDQWSEADAGARAADGRPCLTENRIPTFANQIINDQRQNRPSINISPLGDKASKKDAKILRGMIRAIERDSSADTAYDTGFQSAVHNGWGYWRIVTEYESDESFNKVIVIRPIPNPFNVYLDPSRTPFMLDAGWGFISEMIPREEFQREYPDAQLTPWGEGGTGDKDGDWMNEREIRVAEYYYFDHTERERIMLDNGWQGWEDDLDPTIAADVDSGRLKVEARRTVQVKQLKWAKMTAIEVLERRDCDGNYVPIIECDGTVLNINGKLVKKGIVRDAKSPQRMLNYYTTLEAENVALQPKAPWIMEEGQIEGHEAKWQQANRKSYSYLLYKGVNLDGTPAPPPQRQEFKGPPAAILAAREGTVEALKAVTGIRFDATMSERMKDESGRAIRELNQNANLGAYHYIDNFGRALKNTGIVLVDLIPYVYDTRRMVAIVDEDGTEEPVMIRPDMQQAHAEVQANMPDGNRGKLKLFNPKIGRYRVTASIGPSYATKRVEAQESIMDFMRVVPNAAPLIMDLVAKFSDWEGAEQIASRLAKALDPRLLTPDRSDMSPQVQALIQNLQAQVQQMQQQLVAAAKEAQDRTKDREVIVKQIDSTYAAKHEKTQADLMESLRAMAEDRRQHDQDLAAKVAIEMEKIAQKRESTFQGTVGRQIGELAKAISDIQKALQQGSGSTGALQSLPVGSSPGTSPD
jgi:hypothetical protein